MFKFKFLLIFTAVVNTCSARDDGILQSATNFLNQRHVQTVTAIACWPSGKSNERLTFFFFFHFDNSSGEEYK